MYSVAWIFPYELRKEEILQNNIIHTYDNLKEWIKEKAYLETSNKILSILKFDSQIEHQRKISRKHKEKITEIEAKMNDGISPYKWIILENFDRYIDGQLVKANYVLFLVEKCK